ncbi:hypothetical protein NE237_008521 [Protea cynaroides]|uniref:Protein LNK3 n=1 Tax=Protea cynaroides TaxID=273540 RepID=A0A9Q0KW12_9MAGN|nr:hypothetical protein NE237_008521 [Protea cynaroides]
MSNVSEIDQMDYLVGVEADIFNVSKNPQQSYRFPSPDYYMQWEVANPEHFHAANEFCDSTRNATKEDDNNSNNKSLSQPNVAKEELILNEKNSCDEVEVQGFFFFNQIQVNPQASLDMIRPLSNQLDYHHDGIFLRSQLEETSPGMENPNRSVSILPLPDCNTMPTENLLMDMIAESQSVSMNESTSNISKNPSSHTRYCPSSADWEMKDCSMTEEPVVPGMIPDELNSPYKVGRYLSAGGSLEESVLQELEVVMARVNMTKSTRLCFRDSLYRLAKNSKHSDLVSQNRSGEITMEEHRLSTVHIETSRFGRVNPTDYETNTIDTTIEKLMFDKLDFDTHDISSPESVNLNKETVMTDASPDYDLNRVPVLPYPHCLLQPHDADVSIFGGENNAMVDIF